MAVPVRLADAEQGALHDLVDLGTHPIDDPGSDAWRAVVARAREQLADDGCLVLSGFLRSESLTRARSELAALADKASWRSEAVNVYGRAPEQGLADDDPRRVTLARTLAHVTRDQIPPDSVVARLYVDPGFKAFVAACVGASRVFEYADPLAGLVGNVVAPGGALPWHYDTNEFVVTVVTQQPTAGGRFQYCPALRGPGDENLAGLAAVLRDEHPAVRTLALEPGDLQIFMGRYSLHRVEQVEGDRSRHVAVLGYADRPGVIGPVDRTRAVYGRVTEAHLVAEERRRADAPDGLIL